MDEQTHWFLRDRQAAITEIVDEIIESHSSLWVVGVFDEDQPNFIDIDDQE